MNGTYLPNTDLLTQSLIRSSTKHINLLRVYLCLHLCLFVSLFLLYFCLSLSLSLSVCVSPFCLSLSFCFFIFLRLSLSVCLSLFLYKSALSLVVSLSRLSKHLFVRLLFWQARMSCSNVATTDQVCESWMY